MLWLLAPLVLLFSYKREPQNPTMRMMILVAAIRIIVLLYLESGHQAQPMLNIPRMNLEGFVTGETAAEEASGVKFPGIIDGISCRGKDTAFPGSSGSFDKQKVKSAKHIVDQCVWPIAHVAPTSGLATFQQVIFPSASERYPIDAGDPDPYPPACG